ncbi:peroxiredoxin-like 2C isoform X1 [Choloepus didactylus]|uniref:peroxiredoxin-like 2C isoform X1 n=1 Tax=Choloepus didactylus TaxID=27675 RepID=UPI00189E8667|nr:peroxiredoxin-like 2C isoform X1 [Choloepus didactylus]
MKVSTKMNLFPGLCLSLSGIKQLLWGRKDGAPWTGVPPGRTASLVRDHSAQLQSRGKRAQKGTGPELLHQKPFFIPVPWVNQLVLLPHSEVITVHVTVDFMDQEAEAYRSQFSTLFHEEQKMDISLHFLCYICKEYVEDLAKIPKSFLQEANVTLIVIGQSSYHHIEPFCKLTGYSHEIYVDPEREIYKRLGMKRGEEIASSGQSPHVKSNTLSGSIRSLWRAVTGPLFDFQGDPAQQVGTLILGPGNNVHFVHRDRNRLDHKPINSVLQLVGVQHVNFTSRPSVIHV